MISIIYLTSRKKPMFEWFVDSLYNQAKGEDIELIFVDAVLNIECEQTRRAKLDKAINNKFRFTHVAPDDNIYQGKNRKTFNEYFSPSNTRNTGARYAGGEYIVFVDDVSVLMPTWWREVKRCAEKKIIVGGSYQKHHQMVVDEGVLISSVSHVGGIDSRWVWGYDDRINEISGSQLFGCSIGIPKKYFNEIDGFDQLCDSIGGEDWQFGQRLINAGHKIYYSRSMFTVESEELHNQDYLMIRDDRKLPEDEYMKRLSDFGVKTRYIQGNWDSSHMILDIVYKTKQTKAIGIKDDKYHWFDRKPFSEM